VVYFQDLHQEGEVTGLFKWGAAWAVVSCLVTNSSAADIVIDTFEDGTFDSTDANSGFGSTVFDQSGLTQVVGGSRRTNVQLLVPGTLSASLTTTAGDDAAITHFQQSSPNPSPALPSDVTFIYGITGPLSLNLPAGGNDRFQFSFTSVPSAESFLIVFLNSQTPVGGFADVKVPIPQAGTYEIPFSTFVIQTPGFNFADVDRIDVRLFFSPNVQSASYGLADVRVTIPEPSAACLIPLLLLRRGWNRSEAHP
jgi:hypothetical protein